MTASRRRVLRDAIARAIVGATTAPVRRWSLRGDGGATAMRIACADGTALHADVRAPEGPARGTVILAHGWRDGRHQLAFLAPRLVKRGLRVVAIDFRGHGRSEGSRVTIGAREAEDARAAIEAARATSESVGYVGFSMGASAYLLAGTEADAAVLDSPYDSLDGAVSARVRKLRLPASVAAGLAGAIAAAAAPVIGGPIDRVRPIDAVSSLARPTLFVFARHDPWIDADVRAAFARRLPSTASMRVVFGGHALHFGPTWRREVTSWLDERLAQSSQSA